MVPSTKRYYLKENIDTMLAVDGTSKLGPHLRFGTVSVREIVAKAIRHENITFLKELI